MKMFYFNRRQIGMFIVGVLFLFVAGVGVYGFKGLDTEVSSLEKTAIFRGNPDKKAMALTFNVDWGEEDIPPILEILKKEDVKATFYLSGKWVEKFPELAKQIAEEGHEIGNHGYSHPHVDNLSIEENIREIKTAEEAILKATGKKPRLFAPPYGEKKQHVIDAAFDAGYLTVYWTIDTIDWKRERGPDVISGTVLDKAQNGAIVLMHPVPNTVKALPTMINGIKERGYSLVTVSEIIK